MIRKLLLTTLGFALSVTACLAQQDPLYSQYMFNMMSINPAYAGSRDVLSVTGIYRRQWVNVPGAPVTQLFSIDTPLKNKKVGLGLQILNDEIGINKTTGIYGTYAYKLKLRRGVLAMGIQGGVTRFYANYASLQLSGGNQQDIAFNQTLNDYQPNVGAGIYYSTQKFYAGFSAPHLLGRGTFYEAGSGSHIARQNNHWLFTTGVVIDLSQAVVLKPSVMVRMVEGAPIHVDFNANVWFYRTFSLGVSVRTSETIVALMELQLNKQFRLGYSYDWNTGDLRNAGSHEIMLRYEFGYEKKRMVTPRYF